MTTQTITVAELLADAGKDVRAAWKAGNCKLVFNETSLGKDCLYNVTHVERVGRMYGRYRYPFLVFCNSDAAYNTPTERNVDGDFTLLVIGYTPTSKVSGGFQQARGIFDWHEGDEPAEVTIRRLRDDTPDLLALAEAALQPFADFYEYMRTRNTSEKRVRRGLSPDDYKQAADALEAIRQARGER